MRRPLTFLALAGATVLASLVPSRPVVGASHPAPEVEAAILEASAVWGVPAHRLRCLCRLESGYQPHATSRAGYAGAFQFDAATWREGVRRFRNPADSRFPLVAANASPYDVRAAALVTAAYLAHGEGRRWPPLRRCA